jgi:serine/threonine protein kinase
MTMFNEQTGRLAPQSILQQRYVIVGLAGRGGMSAVYQGIDTRLRQRVAIKEMSQAKIAPTELAEAEARFEQEAHMLSALSHPNLPRIQNSFSENGRAYLVMDYIEGKTLHQLIKEAQGRPLPVAQVIHYALQLCDVLGYLHQQRPPIIFRDVKPSNIMVQPDGHVFLIDFGIARFFKEEQALDTVFLGSPGYAPPEQHGLAQTNPRSDIYGLGATMHYCLTGRDPYYAREQFTFASISSYNPQVPSELDQLVLRMLARDEQHRPASMQEVANFLQLINQVAASHTTAIPPSSQPAQAPTLPFSPPKQTTTPQPAVSASLPPTRPAPPIAIQAAPAPHIAETIGINTTQRTVVPFWTPTFTLLFALLALITIGSSAAVLYFYTAMNAAYGWCFIVASGFALIQLVTFAITSSAIRTTLPRLLLSIVGIATLVTGFASLALGWLDLQNAIQSIITPTILPQLLTGSFIVMALLSLFWLIRPLTGSWRISLGALFIVAALCLFLRTLINSTSLAGYALLLVAFALVLLGQALALHMERTRSTP